MAAALALLLLLVAVPSAAGEAITGHTSVIDGDTLEIRGQRIRLFEIDAPESKQLCSAGRKRYRRGQKAAFALADKVGQKKVRARGAASISTTESLRFALSGKGT